MTERIDKYLDGAIERIALTPDERAEADRLERAIDEIRAHVDARPAPDLTPGVMRSIEQLKLHRAKPTSSVFARLVASLWTARDVSFRFRPAYGLAGAAVIVAAASFVSANRPSPALTATGAQPPRLFVQFRLQAADASTVRLAGSFSNWQPAYELHQSAPGIWTVTLPLSLGVHDYAFLVDGQRWIADPYAQAVDDGFGGVNSRVSLLPPDQSRS